MEDSKTLSETPEPSGEGVEAVVLNKPNEENQKYVCDSRS